MIFRLLIIHNHDRMSSITRVLRTATWDYFTSHLPNYFSRSPQAVKEVIITDIHNLVQEFRRISSDVGASLFAMRRLFGILRKCLGILVCIDIISVFATAVDSADKIYRVWHNRGVTITGTFSGSLWTESEPNMTTESEPIYSWMSIERCWIGHFLNPKI